MIMDCPGSGRFKKPVPDTIVCPGCKKELEIWSDEFDLTCPGCGRRVTRESPQSCLDWCASAKICVGDDVYNRYKGGKKVNKTETDTRLNGREATGTGMFCRQCEQTLKGKACVVNGVCGKNASVAGLQDLLVYALKGIAVYGGKARALGVKDDDVDRFIIEGLFLTVTNVNFDEGRIKESIIRAGEVKEEIKGRFLAAYKKQNGREFAEELPAAAGWTPDPSPEGFAGQSKAAGVMAGSCANEDIRSLREILLYGLKGMASYADHALILGEKDEEVASFFHKGLAATIDDGLSADDLIGLIMEFGKANLKCMEILDRAHTGRFGHPVPARVFRGEKKGPAIIVSGHDLPDLEEILKQAEGKGVNVYTHGEMLPAHGYPGLKKYAHLAGHFGTAWQNQQKEFDGIPAVILMTTNCIQMPRSSYKDRIFTTGLVAWPGVKHIPASAGGRKDFSPLIDKALELGGFKEEKKEGEVAVGFAHNTVIGLADKVLELVGKKRIRRFFLIGGCDGAKPGRNYYTEFAEKLPADCVILTLACGKFRINHLDLGDIEGIPRILDCGQCNDAYSAIQIAVALAKAAGCGVNDLPLSFILSWYEQKAVCILLTLFSLGIKNMRLGPTLPAFVSPNVLNVLVEKFGIKPISTVEKDIEEALEGK